jgi:outer membrane protein assembly factor BamB
MNSFAKITGLVLASALSMSTSAWAAGDWAAACPNPVGVAVVVKPSDAAPAVALAKAGWTVYALAADAGAEKTLHQAAGNWDGRGLWVGRWRGSIPLLDEGADLVVGDVDEKEAKRVLVPVTGAALDLAGKVRFRTTMPAGRDEWTHWLHGPDNNPVSQDTTFAVPSRLAWLGLPINAITRSAAGRVAAGGRVFLATGVGDGGEDAGTPQICELMCRSVYHGAILWRKTLPKGFRAARQIMIASSEQLLIAEGGTILRLNAATGAEISRIDVDAQQQIKWLVRVDEQLLALVGPPDPATKGLFGDAQWPGGGKAAALADGRLGFGGEIIAMDATSGAVKWRHQAPQPIDSRCVAAANGSLYYIAPTGRVAALQLKDGSERWVQSDPGVLDAIAGKRRCDTTVGLEDRPGLVATSAALYCDLSDGTNLVALATSDGAKLWELPRGQGGRSMSVLALQGKVVANGIQAAGILAALTGKHLGQLSTGGCGVITASPSLLFGNAGGPSMDLLTGTNLPTLPLKTQCQVGGFVTDGRLIYPPAACRCPVLTGCIALAKGATAKDLPAPNSAGRLEATLGTDAELRIAPGDWPTHRADSKRSGATATAVAKNLHVAWQAALADPFGTPKRGRFPDDVENLPMPPVAAGGLVVVAGTDGSVRAFDQAKGTARWTAWCEGPVNGTPTLSGGRVVVAAADGAVYAFSAADGQRRWRYRVAPLADQTSLYGAPGSPWPANAPVVVDGGVVYAMAGMPLSSGTAVAALDLSTGAARWATRYDWAPSAGLAMIDGRLWARAFFTLAPAARLDPKTGAAEKDAFSIAGVRGREVAQVAPGLVAYGASEIHHAADDWGCARSETIGLISLDAAGKPELPGITVGERSNVAPAGDADLLVMAHGAGGTPIALEGWDTQKTTVWVRAQSAKIDLSKLPSWRLTQLPENPLGKEAAPVRWGPLPLLARAVALAKDGVVVTVAGARINRDRVKAGYQLLVLDRTTGKTLQTVELPSEPAPEGLCLTRDGGAIVTLRDGGVVGVAP